MGGTCKELADARRSKPLASGMSRMTGAPAQAAHGEGTVDLRPFGLGSRAIGVRVTARGRISGKVFEQYKVVW